MTGNFDAQYAAIFRAVATALGLVPGSTRASAQIFRAYDDSPIPHTDPKEDLCFFHLDLNDEAYYELEVRPEISRWRVDRVIPARLILTLYGLNCESRAIRLSSDLFIDGHDEPLSILRAAGIYPIPPDRPPVFSWEEYGQSWRKRADLVLRLRIKDSSDDTPFDPITTPPEIPECVNGDGSD